MYKTKFKIKSNNHITALCESKSKRSKQSMSSECYYYI